MGFKRFNDGDSTANFVFNEGIAPDGAKMLNEKKKDGVFPELDQDLSFDDVADYLSREKASYQTKKKATDFVVGSAGTLAILSLGGVLGRSLETVGDIRALSVYSPSLEYTAFTESLFYAGGILAGSVVAGMKYEEHVSDKIEKINAVGGSRYSGDFNRIHGFLRDTDSLAVQTYNDEALDLEPIDYLESMSHRYSGFLGTYEVEDDNFVFDIMTFSEQEDGENNGDRFLGTFRKGPAGINPVHTLENVYTRSV